MKKIITVFLVFGFVIGVSGQTLTLPECYDKAERHYPLIRKADLIERTRGLSVENALSGHLPRLQITGQATYQSDVTRIPFEMPGVVPLSKDQYRIAGEVTQTLYQGGKIRLQRNFAEVDGDVEQKALEVDLYQLRHRINELFFGILLLRDQIAQSELIKSDLERNVKTTEAGIEHGIAVPGAADVLRAEVLKVEQRIIEMSASEIALREMLSQFTGSEITAGTFLEKPVFINVSPEIMRPELELFAAREKRIDLNRAQLSMMRKPRLELFIQGGYGRPGLNMLENVFDTYYLGGIRFAWALSPYYTKKRDYQILDLQQEGLALQKETFLFNTNLSLNQNESDIARLSRLIEVDDEIITLRSKVRQTAAVQLQEGVITSADYVREVNAEDQAKQNQALHRTQLLMAQANYYFTTGQKVNP